MRQLLHISGSFCVDLDLWVREQCPAAGLVGGLILFNERHTSITMSHKARASNRTPTQHFTGQYGHNDNDKWVSSDDFVISRQTKSPDKRVTNVAYST